MYRRPPRPPRMLWGVSVRIPGKGVRHYTLLATSEAAARIQAARRAALTTHQDIAFSDVLSAELVGRLNDHAS